jgi:hypothetical protein
VHSLRKMVGMVLLKRALFILCVLLVCSRAGSAQAREAESALAVLAVHLYISNEMVTSDIKSTGLFSEQIAGTIQSGLPAVVEFFYSLEAHDRGSIRRGVLTFELIYDVWDDYYSVKGTDTTHTYTTYDAMTRAVQNLRCVALVPLHKLNAEGEYFFRLAVTVNPLRGSDRKKIAGWVGENVRGGSAGNESWREQVLNLNDLIQHFFTKRKDTNRSEWFRTEFFKPGELLVHDGKEE